MTEYGDVFIGKVNASDIVEVIARDNETVTADELTKACIFVFQKGKPKKSSYSMNEMSAWQVPSESMTYKINNAGIDIDEYGGIVSVSKAAKNMTITATAIDGSKESASLKKLTVTYAEPQELDLMVEKDFYNNGTHQHVFEPVAGDNPEEIHVNATTNTIYRLTVIQNNGEEQWTEVDAATNFKVSVKGAKILSKESDFGQQYLILMNQKTAVITLSDQTKKTTKTYTLINDSFATAAAPRIKASGTLTSERHMTAEQVITYSLSGSYDYKNKYVMVETDAAERNKEDKEALYSIMEEYGDIGGEYRPVADDGTFTVRFSQDILPSGSYKLQMTFGTVNVDGEFVADTKAVSTTLVAEPKYTATDSTYKMTTKIQLALKDKTKEELTVTGKDISSYEFVNLRNKNINGEPNEFCTYFEFAGGEGDQIYLRLKESLSAEQLAYIGSRAGKNDCQGFATYHYTCDDGSENSGTIKLTVTIKDTANRYSTTPTSVLKDAEMRFAVPVKGAENIADAYVESDNFTRNSIHGSDIELLSTTAEIKRYNEVVYFAGAQLL